MTIECSQSVHSIVAHPAAYVPEDGIIRSVRIRLQISETNREKNAIIYSQSVNGRQTVKMYVGSCSE